jgi:hypothetical protein
MKASILTIREDAPNRQMSRAKDPGRNESMGLLATPGSARPPRLRTVCPFQAKALAVRELVPRGLWPQHGDYSVLPPVADCRHTNEGNGGER